MKVHYQGSSNNHRMFVQPGVQHPEVSEWREGLNAPKLIEVLFVNGVADVPDNLGKYLVDNELAKKSRLLLPNKRAH